jgi:hypothetical protein
MTARSLFHCASQHRVAAAFGRNQGFQSIGKRKIYASFPNFLNEAADLLRVPLDLIKPLNELLIRQWCVSCLRACDCA